MKTSTPQESFDFMWKFMASGAPSDPVMQRMGLIHMNNLRPLLSIDHDELALQAVEERLAEMEEELAAKDRLVNKRDIELITAKKALTAAKTRATRLEKKLLAFE